MLDRDLSIRKRVFHNEYTILSALRNQEGIIQLHDFFKVIVENFHLYKLCTYIII